MKTKNILTVAIAASITILIGACGGAKESMLLAPKHALNGDSGNLSSTNLKIFLQAGENESVPKSLQNTFRDVVSEIVTDAGSEVVDRARASKLIAELDLSSFSDESIDAYGGPDVADFVVISTLKSSSSTSYYQKSTTWTDKKGKVHTSPAFCNYNSKVKGTIDIRKLPSLNRMSIINVNGSGSTKDKIYTNRRCNRKNMMDSVTQQAITDTFIKGDSAYLNLTNFIGAKAFITGARKFDGKVYLETNYGRSLGAKNGKNVVIYQYIEGELVRVAEAKFLGDNNIYAKRAFLSIDKDDLTKVRRGMIVKASGDCSGLNCAKSWLKELTQ